MTQARRVLLAAAVVAALSVRAVCAAGAAPEPAADHYATVAAYEFGQSRQALTAIEAEVRRATPEQRKAIEARLVKVLRMPKATFAGKQFCCRMLRRIGSDACVPALAALLPDGKLSHMARFALQGLATPTADEALRAALPAVKGRQKTGVIGSIAARGDRKAVPAIAKLLAGKDVEATRAALDALGRIGGAEAARALRKAEVPDALAAARGHALLRCADSLPEEEAATAAAIYREMFAADKPTFVRIAALRGVVRAEKEKAVTTVLALLKDRNVELQRAAAALVVDVPGAKATEAFAAEMSSLAPASQVVLLAALATRGDRAAGPAVTALADAKDEAVRLAALRALASVGSAANVPKLVAVGAGDDAAGKTALGALARLRGDGVDEAILAAMGNATDEVALALIGTLKARRTPGAIQALMQAAVSCDDSARQAAFGALGALGTEDDIPPLVALLVQTPAGPVQDAAVAAVQAVCGRVKDTEERAAPLLAALDKAGNPGKVPLLRVLGRLGGDKALAAVRGALQATDAKVRDAGIRALTEWPDAAAAGDLLALAETSKELVHRVLALRAVVRLLELPSTRTADETLKLCARAMAAAQRPDEKKLVLGAVGRVPHPDALAMAKKYAADASLRAEAERASVMIASGMTASYPEQAEPALKEIIAATKDAGIRKRAREALEHMEKTRGMIVSWMLSGPYGRGGADPAALFDIAFPPEAAGGGKAKWRRASADANGIVHLDKLVGGANRAAYLRVTVKSPAAQDAVLEAGSDDGAKAWLNGKIVLSANRAGGLELWQHRADVKLAKGDNVLLLKITQGGGDWAAAARFRAAAGGTLQGLTFHAQ
jgi:HEAT repeat protein